MFLLQNTNALTEHRGNYFPKNYQFASGLWQVFAVATPERSIRNVPARNYHQPDSQKIINADNCDYSDRDPNPIAFSCASPESWNHSGRFRRTRVCRRFLPRSFILPLSLISQSIIYHSANHRARIQAADCRYNCRDITTLRGAVLPQNEKQAFDNAYRREPDVRKAE